MVVKKLKSVAHELNLYLKADHIVAVYPDIKAKNNRVNLLNIIRIGLVIICTMVWAII